MRRGFEQTIEAWWQSQDPRPLLIGGARRTGKTYTAEEVGRRLAGNGFVKLDFQTDLDLIAPLFDGPTSDVDAIMSRVADYKRVRLSKETAFVLFDEVQLCERALNSLRFFSGSGWRICGTGSQLGVATRRRCGLFRLYQVVGGMPAAVAVYVAHWQKGNRTSHYLLPKV